MSKRIHIHTLLVAILSNGCSNETEARHALHRARPDIAVTRVEFSMDATMFSCGRGEDGYEFTATASDGPIAGFVCCGQIAKACTVRY